MTRPQRRPAIRRAFPEQGLVMRWPGVRAALAFLACLAGFHEVERSEKPVSQALFALGAGQGSRVLRWLATT